MDFRFFPTYIQVVECAGRTDAPDNLQLLTYLLCGADGVARVAPAPDARSVEMIDPNQMPWQDHHVQAVANWLAEHRPDLVDKVSEHEGQRGFTCTAYIGRGLTSAYLRNAGARQ